MSAEFDNKTNLTSNSRAGNAARSGANNVPQANAGGDDRMWELLSLYADGEASPAEAAQVEQMLRHDAGYARAYTFMRQAGNAVRCIVEVEPPAHLRGAILAKTTGRVTLPRRAALAWGALRGRFVAPVGRLSLAGGALAAVALLIGVYVGHSEPQPLDGGRVVAAARPRGAHENNLAPMTPFRYVLPDPAQFAPMQAAVTPSRPAGGTPSHALTADLAPEGLGSENLASNTTRPAPAAADRSKTAATLKAKDTATPAPLTDKPLVIANAFPVKKSGALRAGAHMLTLAANRRNPDPPAYSMDDAQATQNLYPMMDSRVQHRTMGMIARADGTASDGDNLDDGTFVTSHDSMPVGASTDTGDADNVDGSARHIVGKLQLGKLPPAARHLLTPSEVVRQASATAAMRYSAAATDALPRHEADLPMVILKY